MGRIFFRFPALVSIICHLLSLPKLGISFAATPFTRKPRYGSVNKTGLDLAAYGFRTTGNCRDTAPQMWPVTGWKCLGRGGLFIFKRVMPC